MGKRWGGLPIRVLKNKHQAVSQGVRRLESAAYASICEHLQKPHNAESRPQAQFLNTRLNASILAAVLLDAFVQVALDIFRDLPRGSVEVAQIFLDQVRVVPHARAQLGPT
jgi:hypothetical protein